MRIRTEIKVPKQWKDRSVEEHIINAPVTCNNKIVGYVVSATRNIVDEILHNFDSVTCVIELYDSFTFVDLGQDRIGLSIALS